MASRKIRTLEEHIESESADARPNRTRTSFEQYLIETFEHAVLSPEERQAVQDSTPTTRNPALASRMVDSHLTLMTQMARRYARPGIDKEDLVQEGNIALMTAAKLYDYHISGRSFTAYAIEGAGRAMRRFMKRNSSIISLNNTEVAPVSKKTGRPNKRKGGSARQGFDPSANTDGLTAAPKQTPENAVLGQETAETCLFTQPPVPQDEATSFHLQYRAALAALEATATDDERRAVYACFLDEKEPSQRTVAEAWEVSHTTIQNLVNRAFAKVRAQLAA